ncbi:MAG: APC family permease [Gemmatimonadota bacterium]
MTRSARLPEEAGLGPEPEIEQWEFPGWGRAERLTHLPNPPVAPTSFARHHTRLGTWPATAICGNDITSSVLYVSALCAAQAGILAPVVLLLVGGVLLLYRKIYAEVGSALPLNGGSYTLLLNTTNKRVAAVAACLTLLSYMATAVISAHEATHYAVNLVPGLPLIPGTLALLGLFALLNIIGIRESSRVALVIFVAHLVTLSVLLVAGTPAVWRDPAILLANLHTAPAAGWGKALFFGFAVGMLGISGFESSANFIEEQQPGVFPKTLRNMWLAVVVMNPAISLLSMGLLPLGEIQSAPADLLARMGGIALGRPLRLAVSVDAVLVLSGAVLTSYVGMNGLVRRMTLDRCLPQFLLAENRWRGTNHWIIGGFFGLCASILLVTKGSLGTLAGVYTISFLSVMALYAIGNMLLKRTRARLPRSTRAGWGSVAVALAAVLAGLLGNVLLEPANVEVFAVYFGIAVAVVGLMLLRVQLLRLMLAISRRVMDRVIGFNQWLRQALRRQIDRINGMVVVYFTKGDDLATLNRAARYVLSNELTNCLTVVHVYRHEGDIPPDLAYQLATLDQLYPRLRIDFLAVQGTFGPPLVEALSRRLGVPKNYMFIGTPGDGFPHALEALGGVRVIL